MSDAPPVMGAGCVEGVTRLTEALRGQCVDSCQMLSVWAIRRTPTTAPLQKLQPPSPERNNSHHVGILRGGGYTGTLHNR